MEVFSIKRLIWFTFIGLIFLTGCSDVNGGIMYQLNPEAVDYEIEGNVTDEEVAIETVEIIEKNLQFAQGENIDGYLGTVVSSAHEQTRNELVQFFEDYDLEHTLLSVEIIEQNENEIRIATSQQTIVVDISAGVDDYKDHISEITYKLIKEDNVWVIEESITHNIIFI